MDNEMHGRIDVGAADLLLTTTRSVRKRLDLTRPVPREVILDCLRISQQAPTGSNRQGWHWVVVTDPAKRAALAEMYRETWDAYRASQGDAQGQTARVVDSASYLAEHLGEVPVHVIPCHWGRVDTQGNAMAAGFYGSILPAAWSFMLALRARGLGAAWTTLHLPHEREAAELLGIPYERCSQVALLPVAWTVGTDFKPAARPPVEDVTHWDSW